ncbi:retrovirus-related pol polyprotein from transposon TNT 1-94 [Tanacetum coccineum]|uniref:Retrovirus-related pol polyprotein from transposon TNT 1-94 n=1 Tax=Tanacetum coccineum TaxID=301880 RepID=A0ABQ5HE74_9ASTR
MFSAMRNPLKCINKAMAYLSAVHKVPPPNNQLRTSSNPRNQATIQDGRVTVQQVQGRQNQSYAGTENRGIATNSKGNDVQEMQYSEQTHVDNFQDYEIHSDTSKCLELETELLKKKDFIEQEAYDKLVKSYSNLEKHCISLELATQLNQEIFQRENSGENLNAPTFNQLFEINELKAQSQEKDTSVENLDLNAQLQEKVFAITALKNELRKLKGKNVVNTAVLKPNATIAPGMFKLDIEPISPRLKNNRDAHEVYIEKTIEYMDTLCGFVERARTHNPSESLLESACMFLKHVQELLVYVSQTCPNSPKPSEKLVVVTPMNKDKRVRFAKPVTSLGNIPKQTDSLKTKDSNKPLLTSIGVKPTTSASGLKPSATTKNNRITRPPSSNQKNKHSVRNAKFESICAICNKCLFDAIHDMRLIDFVNDVNVRSKSKSKRNKMRKVWKPTGKVFTDVGYKWKPTGRFFTIIGNSCPLTRITPKKIVHFKETTPKSGETSKPEIKVYSRRPKQIKSVGSSKKAKIIESKIANNSKPIHLWGSNATDVPSSSSLVNDMLSRSSSGLRHNLFSVGQFCDADLEVAFWKNTCFIQNLEGVDLLSGSCDTNLYTFSLDDVLKTSSIYLLSKASKTKSWLWHRRLSHLNFVTLNKLAKDCLARGLGLQVLTPATSSSGLVQNIIPQQPCNPPNVMDWDTLFHLCSMEYFILLKLIASVLTEYSSHMYKLKKALYSLKQAPRTWYDMLSRFLISQHFCKGAADPTLFIQKAGNDLLLVQIYVDDIIFASTNTALFNEFANQMTTKFKMSMMGHMSFFLGL